MYATAADLTRFGALHLPGSDTLENLQALQRPVFPIPGYEYEQQTSCFGWKTLNWSGARILAHDGGAHTFLRVVPTPRRRSSSWSTGPTGR